MKRKVLHSVVFGGLLILASCSMIDSGDERTEVADTDTAYVKISLGDNDSRTALPVIDSYKEFESFTLTGKTGGAVEIQETFSQSYGVIDDDDEGEYVSPGKEEKPIYREEINVKTPKEKIIVSPDDPIYYDEPVYPGYSEDEDMPNVGKKSAFENLGDATFAVKVGKTYEFTLIAKKGGAVWQGSASATIKSGANTINFTLELTSLEATEDSNTGYLRVSLGIPDVVKSISAKLFNMDGTEFDNRSPDTFCYISNGKAIFSVDLPVGNYMLRYELYGDEGKTLKLGEWREYAGIAAEVRSVSYPIIKTADELESIYEINIATNGGSFAEGTTVTGSYTRYSDDIKLPEDVTKNAFVFKGWDKADSDGNALLPKTKITKVSKGSVGNVYASADWAESGIHETEAGVFYIGSDSTAKLAENIAW